MGSAALPTPFSKDASTLCAKCLQSCCAYLAALAVSKRPSQVLKALFTNKSYKNTHLLLYAPIISIMQDAGSKAATLSLRRPASTALQGTYER